MNLKRKEPKIKQVLKTYSWCGVKIDNGSEIFALGCKKNPEIDISKYEGKIMPVAIAPLNKTIWALVPTEDSDARREGKDLMFVLCSQECGNQLKETLQQEKELGDLILSAKLTK